MKCISYALLRLNTKQLLCSIFNTFLKNVFQQQIGRVLEFGNSVGMKYVSIGVSAFWLHVLFLIAGARIQPRLGVSFSPAGLLTPFHIGAAEQLKLYNVLNETTALSGSSGGALAAAVAGLDLSTQSAMFCSEYIAQRCREEGPRQALRKSLDEMLDKSLPVNAHELLNLRGAPCSFAYAEIRPPYLKSCVVCNFTDRSDLVDVLRASCNIPFFFNGNNAFVNVRGGLGVDGIFAASINRFGCPPTGASVHEILVCPYSASMLRMAPLMSRPAGSSCTYSIISPDLLQKEDWPFSLIELISMSLSAPNSKGNPKLPITDLEIEETYKLLYNAGVKAVKAWYNDVWNDVS